MAARTLFSDSQSQLVAHVLNSSLKPKTLSANLLLSTAEPVQCLSGTGCEPDNLVFADSNACCDSMLSDESVMPVSSCLQPAMVPTDGTELCTSSVSAATSDVTDPDTSTSPSGDELEHIDSLRHRAENFICSHANVFSRSEYDIGRTNIIPHCIDTGERSPHFEQLRRHPIMQLPVINEHVQHMLEHDGIELAASPWCSNVVMVRKQDDTCSCALTITSSTVLLLRTSFHCRRLTRVLTL